MSSRAEDDIGSEAETDPTLRLGHLGDALVDAVEHSAAAHVERRVGIVLDAWDGLDPDARARVDVEVATASASAAERVTRELRALVATPAPEQRTTPLEIVRTLGSESTGVLSQARVPAVTRDAFDERAWPDDRYDLVPRTLADLGDPDLAALHLAWGLAKAAAMREP